MAKKDYEEKYTHPRMRKEIKEEIEASNKGGNPGQWSARKSQLLTQDRYEKRGGGYRSEQDEEQKNLQQWTEEEWQTKEGGSEARQDGETKRYLPREAWKKMSEEEEKQQTEEKKQEGSRQGEQYVSNTAQAKRARRRSQGPPINDFDELSVGEIPED